MKIIYAGDSKNVHTRIKTKHCAGNVNTSKFRNHTARRMGFPLKTITKISKKGNEYRYTFIDLDDRKGAEKKVSEYISNGMWRFVECHSKAEAEKFQWYVIEKAKPEYNVNCGKWDKKDEKRFEELYEELLSTQWEPKSSIKFPKQPGVYLFGHNQPLQTIS